MKVALLCLALAVLVVALQARPSSNSTEDSELEKRVVDALEEKLQERREEERKHNMVKELVELLAEKRDCSGHKCTNKVKDNFMRGDNQLHRVEIELNIEKLRNVAMATCAITGGAGKNLSGNRRFPGEDLTMEENMKKARK